MYSFTWIALLQSRTQFICSLSLIYSIPICSHNERINGCKQMKLQFECRSRILRSSRCGLFYRLMWMVTVLKYNTGSLIWLRSIFSRKYPCTFKYLSLRSFSQYICAHDVLADKVMEWSKCPLNWRKESFYNQFLGLKIYIRKTGRVRNHFSKKYTAFIESANGSVSDKCSWTDRCWLHHIWWTWRVLWETSKLVISLQCLQGELLPAYSVHVLSNYSII